MCVGNGATVAKIMTPFRTPAYSTEGEERAMRSEALYPRRGCF